MEKKSEKRGLGRGLSALMADVNLNSGGGGLAEDDKSDGILLIPIQNLQPNPDQPRKTFDQAALKELAESIKSKGIIQPLVVRSIDNSDNFQIVAGERRWRAAQIAQIHKVPVVVRSFSDSEVMEIAIIENIQRADLNAIEEAVAFRQLMDKFGHTQEKLAEALSKSRSHIANTLRLLSLPAEVQTLLQNGKLSAGHARALIGAGDPLALALKVIGASLSVRETEKLARKLDVTPNVTERHARVSEKDADTRAIEADLSANLRMGVLIDHDPGVDGAGTLRIRYNNLDQLDMLCQVLSVIPRDFTP